MKLASVIATVACGIGTAGCDLLGIDETRHRVLQVAPFKGNCHGLFETLCLQVREPDEEGFQNMYETPVGFAYAWGFDYVIRVEERDIDDPPADGSSIRRTLDRQISKTAVAPGTTFDVTIPGGFLSAAAPGLYELSNDGVELRCPEALPCGDLDALVGDETRLGFTLTFPDPPGAPLVIESWEACEPFAPCGGG